MLAEMRKTARANHGWVRCALTIVGGGRDALAVRRGGTQSKLRARRPCDTWSSGASISPLDGPGDSQCHNKTHLRFSAGARRGGIR
jgi:hypothetical protein